MYTNRINTAGNPIYEEVNSFEVMFCPYCGAMNYLDLDWCGSIKGLVYCEICGAQIL